jgi:hypothetical protein
MAARGWRSRLDPDVSARRFWAVAIGVALQGNATGRSFEWMVDEMLALIGAQADAPAVHLRVIGNEGERP